MERMRITYHAGGNFVFLRTEALAERDSGQDRSTESNAELRCSVRLGSDFRIPCRQCVCRLAAPVPESAWRSAGHRYELSGFGTLRIPSIVDSTPSGLCLGVMQVFGPLCMRAHVYDAVVRKDLGLSVVTEPLKAP